MARLTSTGIAAALRQTARDGTERVLPDDDGSKGTGRLALRVRANRGGATGTWMVMVKRDGKRDTSSIGRWPDMDLAAARAEYMRRRDAIAAGLPLKTERMNAATVRDLFDLYIEHLEAKNAASVGNVAYNLGKLADHLGPTRLARELTTEDVAAVLEKIHARAPGVARNTFRAMRAAIRHAAIHRIGHQARPVSLRMPADPTAMIRVDRSPARSTVLTPDEIRAIWHFPGDEVRHVLRLGLLTGSRPTEALALRPGDVTPGRWHKPKTKNGKAHIAILGPLGQVEADALAAMGGLTLTVQHFSQRIWRWMADREGRKFQARDVRRTVRTMMEERSEDPLLLDLHLNHQTMRSGVARHYVHAERMPDREALTARWEAVVREIVGA